MNMADRIQHLRKVKGISQEKLADKIGVSRQAVSKWESQQSVPDLEKIISMSAYFEVTTDYILKGSEPVIQNSTEGPRLTSKMLYITSTTFVIISLLCAFGGWHEKQTMDAVIGAMVIQVVAIFGYFAGKLLSAEKPPAAITWLNIIGVLFMPLSMGTGMVSILVFQQGWVAPYPSGIWHPILFGIIYLSVCVISFNFIFKSRKGTDGL